MSSLHRCLQYLKWWQSVCAVSTESKRKKPWWDWSKLKYTVHNLRRNEISIIKFISFNVFTNSKRWNRGFSDVWHCFSVPECSLSRHDAVFKRHNQCTHCRERDNEHLTNGSHFICQYHTSSLATLLCCPIATVLGILKVLAPYI
jgi:hypothetical protein